MKALISKLRSLKIVEAIELAGGQCYLVGGVVRDHLLGIESKDIDLLVTGIPAEPLANVLTLLGKVDQVGVSFGVIKLNIPGELEIDIALPRTEVKIGDGHTDFDVKVDHTLPIEIDLQRRDFTINAIAVSMDGDYIDPFNGRGDLKNGLIRCVSRDSFTDDPLRIYRGFQFAARFGFNIEEITFYLMKRYVGRTQNLSGERINTELTKLTSKGDAKSVISSIVISQLPYYMFQDIDCIPLDSANDTYNYDPTVTGRIESVPQLLMVLTGFSFMLDFDVKRNAFSKVVDRFKLSVDQTKELEAIHSIMADPSRYNITVQAKKWPGLWTTKFFELPSRPWWQRLLVSFGFASFDHDMYGFNEINDDLKAFNAGKYPKSLKQLNISSEDVMSFEYVGYELGEKLKDLFQLVLNDEVENTYEALLDCI